MKSKLILMLFLLSFIPFVNAGIVLDATPDNMGYVYRIGDYAFYDASHQFVVNTPYQIMNGVSYVDGVTFRLGRTTIITPNQPLVFKIYRVSNNNYNLGGSYPVEDFYNIQYTSITDYGIAYHIYFDNPIYLNPNESLSYGFYSTTTNGSYYIFGDYRENYKKFINHNSYYPIIRDLNNNYVVGSESINQTDIDFRNVFIKIYGGLIFPDTPLPTPPIETEYDSNGTLFCPSCNGTMFPNASGGSGFTPNWSEPNVPCPDCIGNETIIPNGNIPSNKGVGSVLRTIGYCSTLGCSIDDIISFLYDFSIIGFWVSFIILVYKAYKIYHKR